MEATETNALDRQTRCGTEELYAQAQQRWSVEFHCPQGGRMAALTGYCHR